MHHLGTPRKNRTLFGRVVANRDHPVEVDVAKLVNVRRFLVRNINTDLGHHLHGVGVEAVGLNPR